jgi:hypothetical protein
VEARLANLPPCLIGMEACTGAHHLSRKLQALGHDARLMPAKYVRPYSKGEKNDGPAQSRPETRSERALCRDVQVNLAYRWFCGSRSRTRAGPFGIFARSFWSTRLLEWHNAAAVFNGPRRIGMRAKTRNASTPRLCRGIRARRQAATVNAIGKCARLAHEAARSPRDAAAAAAASATSARSTGSATSGTAPASAAASALSVLLAELARSGVFLVENKERAEADVEDFLFTETDLWVRRGIP